MIEYRRTIVLDNYLNHDKAKLLRLSNNRRQVWVQDDYTFDERVMQRKCSICRNRNHTAVWRPADRTAHNRSHRICEGCMNDMARYTSGPVATVAG